MKLSRQQFSWLLFDPANASYALVVRTLLAPLFFAFCARGIYSDAEITSLWAIMVSAAGVTAGIISVLGGPLIDARRGKVIALFVAMMVCVASCIAYFWCVSGDAGVVLFISFCGIAAYMSCNSFYDSLLPDIASHGELDHLSALGFALGYGGGLLAFLICLPLVFLLPESAGMRWSFVVVAIWFVLWSLPLFCNVRQPHRQIRQRNLLETLRFVLENRNVLVFLTAYFLYIDGVGTVLLAAAPLAAGLKISSSYLMITILGLQVLGLPFTLLYGKLAMKFPVRSLIYVAIGVYVFISLLTGLLSVVPDIRVRQVIFIIIAVLVGTSQGGIQALSRSLFSRLIPQERAAELFGVYNIFGKFTTLVGPFFLVIAAKLWQHAELGITMMTLPFLLGAWLLGKVKIPEQEPR